MQKINESTTVRDKLWIFGDLADYSNLKYGIKGISQITPVEAACYLGISNLIMVRTRAKPEPPFDQFGIRLSSLKRVVWSIVSGGGFAERVSGAGYYSDIEVPMACDLASKFSNIIGFFIDDLFHPNSKKSQASHFPDWDRRYFLEFPDKDGTIAVYSPSEIKAIKKYTASVERETELWTVFYKHNLGLPKEEVEKYLQEFDVVTFWTWRMEDLKNLQKNFEYFEKLYPSYRKVLGCYMHSYGDRKAIPIALHEEQCEMGLKWLKEKRIEGIVFASSSICDLEIDAVKWTKEWISNVGEESCG
jgi:hypothetical protein